MSGGCGWRVTGGGSSFAGVDWNGGRGVSDRGPGTVLHVLRADHESHLGGDLVQLRATVDGLRALGVDALAATVAEGPKRVDVVHLYNLQLADHLHSDLAAARRRWPQAAVALSPVWWPVPLLAPLAAGDPALASRAVRTAAGSVLRWRVLRDILARSDLVLPNSDAEVAALERRFRLRADGRWVVVRNGIHLERWPVRRASESERAGVLSAEGLDKGAAPVVICVARVETWKNQRALIRAVDRLPGAGLLLVGPVTADRYGRAVQTDVAARPGRVALTGRRSHEEVARLLAVADVHVLPSYRETPGLATLEAAATGCAVVVTSEGSAAEYLGSTAHIASTRASSLARAVAAAVDDRRQPEARRAVERYPWAASASALAAAYRSLAATRS